MEAPEKLNGICEVLESYIMRRIIARESSKGYNKLFTSLIANGVLDETLLKQRLLNTEDGVTSTPNDSALLQGFKQSKLTNLQSKGVIYLIESKIRPVDSAVSLLSLINTALSICCLRIGKEIGHPQSLRTKMQGKTENTDFSHLAI